MPREIVVVKKSRDDPLIEHAISFPAFPLDRLHLELMENKKKLKKNLPLLPVAKKQKLAEPIKPGTQFIAENPTATAEKPKKPSEPAKVEKDKKSKKEETKSEKKSEKEEAKPEKKSEKEEAKPEKKPEKKSKKEETKSEKKSDKKEDKKNKKDKKNTEHEELDDKTDQESDSDSTSEDSDSDSVESVKSEMEDGDDPLLAELGEGKAKSTETQGDNNAAPGTESEKEKEEKPAEEEPQDEYAHLSPEEREAKEKQEYIWKFRTLRKRYPRRKDIPIYNEHDDLLLMKSTYDNLLRDVTLDENVSSYRDYLIAGWAGMEFLCGTFIGIDMEGFTKRQIAQMNKYDSLLVELGERSYNRWKTNLPVEIRLIGLILFQAALFYLGKMFSDSKGTAGFFFKALNGQHGQSTNDEEDEEEPKKKPKMKGPSITPEEIKKMHSD